MGKYKIKRIDDNGNETYFIDLQDASKSIITKIDDWKVQLFIANAINNNIKAFKYKWSRVDK